ncbi:MULTISPECIES: 16S rRNA (uracil(1498)-N(3))-methyltransferase [unclassified Helicobacter]|uniref:16S rRNA (uracil(1498)-N(3))-methyltransferase n=1 Tax=unclassified Helicobacter TaxID=2593540 RepID=UPI000CF11AA0|nr:MULTISPECIES: 16S rRNA (uracil(1498)-N(3))-methyltransferase [unclassified Helicobacter]
MKFCFHSDAGNNTIKITENLFNHLYKSRRTKFETLLDFRNLRDDNIYTYKHIQINKKDALLELVNQKSNPVVSTKKLHLIWAITESKTIEKTIPYLNQLGVKKITLFFANRSQKNEKISLEKLQKILISSCEQCNRTDLMAIEILKNTKEAIQLYPLSFVLDFDGNNIYTSEIKNFENGIFIGPEGGFDSQERKLFENQKKLCIPNEIILKSECAAMLVSSLATV